MPSDGKVFLGGFPICLFISMNVFASSNVLIFFGAVGCYPSADMLGNIEESRKGWCQKILLGC